MDLGRETLNRRNVNVNCICGQTVVKFRIKIKKITVEKTQEKPYYTLNNTYAKKRLVFLTNTLSNTVRDWHTEDRPNRRFCGIYNFFILQ